ncbi:MAG: hypothetical protein IJ647_11750, partial [Prevotella sp.]|nr:hypothetical protein [Prevotella sp.]
MGRCRAIGNKYNYLSLLKKRLCHGKVEKRAELEYGRIGHLFQDRFRSEPCNTPEYFFTLFRYIHQNPVKAGLVKLAQDYPYSSWPNDYLSLGQ